MRVEEEWFPVEVENKLFRESLDSSVNVTFANPTPEQRWTALCKVLRGTYAGVPGAHYVRGDVHIHVQLLSFLHRSASSLTSRAERYSYPRKGKQTSTTQHLFIVYALQVSRAHSARRARRPLPCMRSTSTGDTKHVNSPALCTSS